MMSAMATIGMTTAMAMVPPDDSFPDEPPCSPAAPSVEGVAEALEVVVLEVADVC